MDQSDVSTILSGIHTTMFDINPGVRGSTLMSLDISTKHLAGLIDLVSMPNLEIDHNDRCNVNRSGWGEACCTPNNVLHSSQHNFKSVLTKS